jgi:predicted metalloprotease
VVRRADIVTPVSSQQWGAPPYGQPPGGALPYGRPSPYGQPYASQGFGQPAFGPGQGFGAQTGVPHYGPTPGLPGPRRRSPLGMLLLGLIGVALVAIAGFVVAGLGSSTPEVAYQNEDYKVPPPDTNPPPIPVPDTYQQAEQTVSRSPFYAQSAPIPVRCDTQPINVDTASDAQLKSHFEGMLECLLRVWQPPITKAGLQIVRPSVTIYGDKMTTKCGTSGINAFYCGADQQVYYSNKLAEAIPIVKTDKWAADVVIAHEFGHALQGRSGILVSAKALGQNTGDEAQNLRYTRRLETQADCFSGMFIRSVSVSLGVQQSDLQGIENVYKAIGDDTLTKDPNVVGNHGLARSRLFWGQTGLGTSAVAKCNTFVAPSNEVR